MNTLNGVRAMSLILFLGLLLGADAAPKVFNVDDVAGLWWSPKKDSQIEVYRKDGKYYGKLAWILHPDKLDIHNHDPKKRAQKLLGMDIFLGLGFDGRDTWKDGTLYDPQSGNNYQGYLRLESRDAMTVNGFISLPLIGRIGASKKFQRVEPNDPTPGVTPAIPSPGPSATPPAKKTK